MTAAEANRAPVVKKEPARGISMFIGANFFKRINVKLVLTLTLILWFGAYALEWYRDQLIGRAFVVDSIHVVDGDTFMATVPEMQLMFLPVRARFRLRGVDAPERDQPYGAEAKEVLQQLLTPTGGYGSDIEIVCRVIGKDEWGRFITDVLIREGFYAEAVNVQKELVRLGAAWSFPAFSKSAAKGSEQSLEELMLAAREQKLGLWKNANPEAPWTHRKLQREMKQSKDAEKLMKRRADTAMQEPRSRKGSFDETERQPRRRPSGRDPRM